MNDLRHTRDPLFTRILFMRIHILHYCNNLGRNHLETQVEESKLVFGSWLIWAISLVDGVKSWTWFQNKARKNHNSLRGQGNIFSWKVERCWGRPQGRKWVHTFWLSFQIWLSQGKLYWLFSRRRPGNIEATWKIYLEKFHFIQKSKWIIWQK